MTQQRPDHCEKCDKPVVILAREGVGYCDVHARVLSGRRRAPAAMAPTNRRHAVGA